MRWTKALEDEQDYGYPEESAKSDPLPQSAPPPFNTPRVRVHYPRWVVASIRGVGEFPVVVNDQAQEAAVKAQTASFKVTKSAQGDSYEIV